MRRFILLEQRQRDGEITGLERQVPFKIEVNGQKICKYVADFTYFEDGVLIVHDEKGVHTAEFKLKRKLMRAIHGIDIRVT